MRARAGSPMAAAIKEAFASASSTFIV
jgi:hypothetical protein